MTDEIQILETIDNYLNGNMPEQERLAFEERMAFDEELAAKVSEVREVNEAIYYANLSILKENVGRDIKKIKYKSTFDRSKPFILTIAILTLLSTVSWYFIYRQNGLGTPKSTVTIPEVNDETNTGAPEAVVETAPSLHTKDSVVTGNIEQVDIQVSDEKTDIYKEVPEAKISLSVPDHENENTDSLPETDIFAKPKITDTVAISHDPEPKKEPEKEVVCDKTFEFKTSPSCRNKATGSVRVITDGKSEYLFELDNFNSNYSGVFNNLASGIYDLKITYKEKCSFNKLVRVEEEWCPLNSSYSFNPDYGEKWEIQYEDGAQGNFIILDNLGKQIYTGKFGSGNESWDGTDAYGNILPVGTYLAFINYSDGRREKVELTIVR